MKLAKNLVQGCVLSALSLSAVSFSAASYADTSANIGVSNMYLWRGTNLSPDGGMVSGGLDYSHASGFYAGVWTSSESGGHETDLYLGFSGEAAGVGYELGWIEYMYPEDGTYPLDGISDTDFSELKLGLSYGPVAFEAYINTDSDTNDDNYYASTGAFDKLSVTYGMWSLEVPGAGATGPDEYSHLTFNYAATEEFNFAVSFAMSDLDASSADAVEEDPLFSVTYTKSFDL